MSIHFAALAWALRASKALNFKPYCGLGQAMIKLPGDDRDKECEKGNIVDSAQ